MGVGAISDRVAEALVREGHAEPAAHSITITRERLFHVGPRKVSHQRLTPADLDRLPQGLARPRAVLYDTRRRNLIYAYDAAEPGKDIVKVAVQPNMSQSLKLGGRHRETVTSHSVRTAGYVHRPDLTGGSRYRLIEGSLETSPDDLADMGRLRPGRWEGGGEG